LRQATYNFFLKPHVLLGSSISYLASVVKR
jgi:hypothetical protein